MSSNHTKANQEVHSLLSAISPVLVAASDWQQVLKCAPNPKLNLTLTKTPEADGPLLSDDIRLHPPKTFPAKGESRNIKKVKTKGGGML